MDHVDHAKHADADHFVGDSTKTPEEGTQMGKPVVHFEVIGRDAPKLQKFYGTLFDWNVDTSNPGGYGTITPESAGMNGGIGGGGGNPQDASYGVTFYVQVADLKATLDKAEKLGGKTLMPPTEIPGTGGVTLAAFSDPEGNRIGLTKG